MGLFAILSCTLFYCYSMKTYTLHTSRGPLIGYQSPVFPTIVTFTGIPYAIQPIGPLRFRHTNALSSFPKNAGAEQNLGNACPQSKASLGPDAEPYPQDEQCLYFHLAVPLSFFSHIRAVDRALVTIHGGAFVSGSSGSPGADYRHPAVLDENVASFSINYRLGVLGFVTDHADHLNAGFHDQQLALEVISDVCAALGVQRLLLAGESAGATSVAAHLLATHSGFDAALMQSPPAGVRLTTIAETADRWTQLLQETECLTIKCLQNRHVDQIMTYQAQLLSIEMQSLFDGTADNFGLMSIGIVQDGHIFVDSLLVRQYVSGDGRHNIPVMVGSMEDEAFYQVYVVFPQILPRWLYPLFSSYLVGVRDAAELRARYPLIDSDNGDVRKPIGRLVTSWAFGCGTHNYAIGSPDNVYYYFYTHGISRSTWGSFCVNESCHADDLPILYNASTPPISVPEVVLGTQWRQRAWAMVDSPDPWAHPNNMADGIEIGRGNWTPVTFNRSEHNCDFWDRFSMLGVRNVIPVSE
jgi:carboxylesterase type B